MTPMKLNVFFAFYPYGGNGGISSEVPDIRRWWGKTLLTMKADPRIGEIADKDFSDTPIPMTRNQSVEFAKKVFRDLSVKEARQWSADVIVMVDSDMSPDRMLYLGYPDAKPWWDTSFNFLYQRKLQGLLTIVGAPYGGPPPTENVYLFQWVNRGNADRDQGFRIAQISREDAARRAGMSGPNEIAALPTGLIMFDMDVFEHSGYPYSYYEYEGDGEPCTKCGCRKPGPQAFKASTDDVTMTRDVSLGCMAKLGYSPLFCNWDAWAGHWKPYCVIKPMPIGLEQVSEKYKQAFLRAQNTNEKLVFIGTPDGKEVGQPRAGLADSAAIYDQYRTSREAPVKPVEHIQPKRGGDRGNGLVGDLLNTRPEGITTIPPRTKLDNEPAFYSADPVNLPDDRTGISLTSHGEESVQSPDYFKQPLTTPAPRFKIRETISPLELSTLEAHHEFLHQQAQPPEPTAQAEPASLA